MVSTDELLAAVDAAFVDTGGALAPWPDPHPAGVSPAEAEYERLTDPGKWRIVGARADAWAQTLVAVGVATVEPDVAVPWREAPRTDVSGTVVVRPVAAGALPLVVVRNRMGGVDGAGVLLGVGEPAVELALLPDCGCDACDGGSQGVLDELDRHVLGVVTGVFRRLSVPGRQITVIEPGSSSASSWMLPGSWGARGFRRGEVDAVLADPTGWDELTGASWFGSR